LSCAAAAYLPNSTVASHILPGVTMHACPHADR
jgi:hypothetical protein